MRSIAEFRDRQIKTLAFALQRPVMFCGHDRYADLYFDGILRDLSWLDERDADYAVVSADLMWGALRVYGQIHYQNLTIPGFANEIASTYAQAAYRLGYFNSEHLLSEEAFTNLQSSITDDFLSTDHTESELVARFGPPAHEVVGGETTVLCYGCSNRTFKWIYFDFSRCYPPVDLTTYEWFADPLLRDIRRNRNIFELLPFANWCAVSRSAGEEETLEQDDGSQ